MLDWLNDEWIVELISEEKGKEDNKWVSEGMKSFFFCFVSYV